MVSESYYEPSQTPDRQSSSLSIPCCRSGFLNVTENIRTQTFRRVVQPAGHRVTRLTSVITEKQNVEL